MIKSRFSFGSTAFQSIQTLHMGTGQLNFFSKLNLAQLFKTIQGGPRGGKANPSTGQTQAGQTSATRRRAADLASQCEIGNADNATAK